MTEPSVTSAAPSRPLLAGLSLGAICGLLTGLAFGIFDGAQAGLRGSPSAPIAIALALCLYAPLGVVLGLVLGSVAGGVLGLLGTTQPSGLLAELRRRPTLDQTVAAGLIAGAVCLAMEVALVHIYGMTAASTMSNRRLASLSTALVASGGIVLLGALFFPMLHVLRKITRVVPRGATLLVVVLSLAGLAGVTARILGGLDWRVLHFGPVVMALVLALSTALLIWIQLRRRATGWQTLPVLLSTIVIGAGLGLASPIMGRSAAGIEAGQVRGLLLPSLIAVGRNLSDRDDDGYSAYFNGGDCDDANAAIHPGAADLPGNGIDENCEGGDAKPAAERQAPASAPAVTKPAFDGNLLIVVVDTLRADKLGVMGNRDGLTPTMDKLAGESVLFTETYAQGPNTPQSFPSFFTSRYPSRVPFKKAFTGYPELTPEALTFFEVLKQAGVTTAAVTSHFYFTEKRGITQGVDDWDNRDATNLKDSNKDIASPRIVPRAVEKLKNLAAAKRRFAMFVHLFEPHSTYVTHPGDPPIEGHGMKAFQRKYDLEVKFADAWLGKLLEGLRAAGLDKNTVVLVFGDHAEAFGEHKLNYHGQTLYNECLHVPLLLRLPGAKPRRVTERVALLDLGPTVLELMGAPVPPSFQGRSLLPLVHGEKGPAERRIGAVLLAYPAWPKAQQTLWSGHYKAIFRITENRFEVYDLDKDPGEQRDLSDDAALAARLRRELVQFAEQELQ